jgi:hypothetical protein
MRNIAASLLFALIAAVPAAAVEFLGVDLCVGSIDTSVVLPVGSPLSLESAEIGRYGGLLLLFKAENGDIMDHIDNLMSFYTDTRGTGDAKKLQWTGNELTAYAQLIKKGYAALAVSTTDGCLDDTAVPEELEAAIAAQNMPENAIESPTEIHDAAAVTAAAAIDADTVAEAGVDTAAETAVAAAVATPVAAAAATVDVEVEPEPTADFFLKGNLKNEAAEDGWVDVMGIVVNNSGTAYTVASFDLSLYDGSGELMCVDTISVNQLRDGQERAFRSAIRCADYDAEAVADWKIQFAGAH